MHKFPELSFPQILHLKGFVFLLPGKPNLLWIAMFDEPFLDCPNSFFRILRHIARGLLVFFQLQVGDERCDKRNMGLALCAIDSKHASDALYIIKLCDSFVQRNILKQKIAQTLFLPMPQGCVEKVVFA